MKITTSNCKLIDWTNRDTPLLVRYKIMLTFNITTMPHLGKNEVVEIISNESYPYEVAEKIRDQLCENNEKL